MDWSLQFHEIVLSLSGKKVKKGNEVVDKDLLSFLNLFGNDQVQKFRDDVYLVFDEDKEAQRIQFQEGQLQLQTLAKEQEIKDFQTTQKIIREYRMNNLEEVLDELSDKFLKKKKIKNDLIVSNIKNTAEFRNQQQVIENKLVSTLA